MPLAPIIEEKSEDLFADNRWMPPWRVTIDYGEAWLMEKALPLVGVVSMLERWTFEMLLPIIGMTALAAPGLLLGIGLWRERADKVRTVRRC